MRNSGKPSEVELRKKQEIENGWESLEDRKEADRGDQIGQLNDLRFKMQTGNKNSPRERSGGNLENDMPCMRKGIPQEATYNKYGDTERKVEIGDIKKHGAFTRIHFSEIQDGS